MWVKSLPGRTCFSTQLCKTMQLCHLKICWKCQILVPIPDTESAFPQAAKEIHVYTKLREPQFSSCEIFPPDSVGRKKLKSLLLGPQITFSLCSSLISICLSMILILVIHLFLFPFIHLCLQDGLRRTTQLKLQTPCGLISASLGGCLVFWNWVKSYLNLLCQAKLSSEEYTKAIVD